MKLIRTIKAVAFLALGMTLTGMAQNAATPKFYEWAPTPPMGWNSWDAFGSSVTEKDIIANADYMDKNLKSHGWNYVVIDIQWYEPTAKTDRYIKGAILEMDGFGRLLPAPNRFPTTKLERSFKPIADYVHSKGLKFGLHIMRGIPRQAVDRDNCPIEGTTYKAADIADKAHSCFWNQDMYGVDMTKPGAQEYYNSVYRLFASWGLDFVKVDDLAGHPAEIEGIRKAIDNCGRPILLSVSMGSQATQAEHLKANATMWRISFDFWDNWRALYDQFKNMNDHNFTMGPGHWPDADMLPFGHLKTWETPAHFTYFTKDEQTTVMTLWCIGRSPLMMGGDMPDNDEFTLGLMTNDEIIAVNQNSTNNRQLFAINNNTQYAWVADVPGSKDKYVALFNAAPAPPPRAPRGPRPPGVPGGPGAAAGADTPNAGVATGANTPNAGAPQPPMPPMPPEEPKTPAPPVNPKDLLPAKVTVSLADLGFTGSCQVRDLWAKKDLGSVKKEISAVINSHGSVIFRVSPE